MSVLQVQLRKEFKTRKPRRFSLNVEFTAPAGVTVLFGPSGSGKTTVLQCVAGLLSADSGQIAIGEDMLFDSACKVDLPPQARRIGYVFQDLALFPHKTAEQNIAFGTRAKGDERRHLVRDILERFHISQVAKQRPDELSGGERQRVALARALVTQPRSLLLDEPFSALDDVLKLAIISDLKRWLDQHRIPVLLVTHDRSEASALGERMLVLHEGRITPEKVSEHASGSRVAGPESNT